VANSISLLPSPFRELWVSAEVSKSESAHVRFTVAMRYLSWTLCPGCDDVPIIIGITVSSLKQLISDLHQAKGAEAKMVGRTGDLDVPSSLIGTT
jgi:hypothetical protein